MCVAPDERMVVKRRKSRLQKFTFKSDLLFQFQELFLYSKTVSYLHLSHAIPVLVTKNQKGLLHVPFACVSCLLQGEFEVQAFRAFQECSHCQIDFHSLITTERENIYLLSCY